MKGSSALPGAPSCWKQQELQHQSTTCPVLNSREQDRNEDTALGHRKTKDGECFPSEGHFQLSKGLSAAAAAKYTPRMLNHAACGLCDKEELQSLDASIVSGLIHPTRPHLLTQFPETDPLVIVHRYPLDPKLMDW